MWSIMQGMERKDYEYAPVRMPKKLKARLRRIAKAENRGVGKQAEILIAMGLAEYECVMRFALKDKRTGKVYEHDEL